ncbi:PASTA domain-containing protein [bacterium]|nr:PASTA domain-containing protein [bacterium]
MGKEAVKARDNKNGSSGKKQEPGVSVEKPVLETGERPKKQTESVRAEASRDREAEKQPAPEGEPSASGSAESASEKRQAAEERREKPAEDKPAGCLFTSWSAWLGLLWSVFKVCTVGLALFTSLAFGIVFGITIYRTYFAIPEEIEVPAIQGQDFAKANDFLKNMGLRLRLTEGRYSSKFPNRVIIYQEPAAGKPVRKDREILAVVSLGPERSKIPNLKGYTLREVKKILANNKLNLGKVVYVEKDNNRPEEVLEQSPAAGSTVNKGDKVNITINKGFGMAKVVVPDCVGRQVGNASALLKKSNLSVGSIKWSVSEDKAAGQVLSQSPPGSSNVMSDSEVELEVSLGAGGRNMLCKHKLELFLPAGSEPQDVRVMIFNGRVEEEVYRASHVMGDNVCLWISGSPGNDIEVYLNDKLFMRDKF